MIREPLSSNNAPLRLVKYLKDFTGLRTTVVRDLSKYEKAMWFKDMPQGADCLSPIWTINQEEDDPDDYQSDSSGSWLFVKKQHYADAPDIPEKIIPWINSSDILTIDQQLPQLRDSILVAIENEDLAKGSSTLERIYIEDNPDVKEDFDAYSKAWTSWFDKNINQRKVQELYTSLFGVYNQIRKQGESLELVMGFGLLEWKTSAGINIRRHLLTTQVEIIFNPGTEAVAINFSRDGKKIQIEDDMLEADHRIGREQYESLQQQLDAIDSGTWDEGLMHRALRYLSQSLSPNSIWSSGISVSEPHPSNPVISFAPAIILRKRTQSGMIRAYETIERQIEFEQEVPPLGWIGLTKTISDSENVKSSRQVKVGDDEIYFPLPANKEQRAIVNALDKHRGVLVQGPPGTGKTHTIANLICHLLAKGQRILITAETARALTVLKEKLPKEIKPLCVSLLAHGGDAFSELNASVEGITSRQASYTPGQYDSRITSIGGEIDKCRRRISEIDLSIRLAREAEVSIENSIANGAYTGSLLTIASQISSDRDKYSWMILKDGAPKVPRFSGHDLIKWLDICLSYSEDDISVAMKDISCTQDMAHPDDFFKIMEGLSLEKNRFEESSSDRLNSFYQSVFSIKNDKKPDFLKTFEEIEAQRLSILRKKSDWQSSALIDLSSGGTDKWSLLLKRSSSLSSRAAKLIKDLGRNTVSISGNKEAQKYLNDIKFVSEFIDSGGKWKSLGIFTPAKIKDRIYIRDDITVNGSIIETTDDLKIAHSGILLSVTIEQLSAIWESSGLTLNTKDRDSFVLEVRECEKYLTEVFSYIDLCANAMIKVSSYSSSFKEPRWFSNDIGVILRLIGVANQEKKYVAAVEAVNNCLNPVISALLLPNAHPIMEKVKRSVVDGDISTYSHLFHELVEIEGIRALAIFKSSVEDMLKAHAPKVMSDIMSSIDDFGWRSRLELWSNAWQWALADKWLKNRSENSCRNDLFAQRKKEEENLSGLISESASLQAWKHFFERLTDEEASSLRSWREIIKSMGMGTGKSAKMARLKAEAREYMDQCRDSIPVWIMPRYLVAEMMKPTAARHDVIIIDEASQLGIESLFLFYMAKKMVVVGDDQQISPYGIGVSDDSVAQLQEIYLKDIPHKHALSAQSSLYANAKIRFSQSVVLREHFRCMPEIIQFSNDLCYASNGTPLDPLRSYTADRLDPLVTVHIPGGYRTGDSQHAQNPPEADAIVDQIEKCISDPKYSGKTIGVISLQGETQAKLIEKTILERIDPAIISSREIICGDASALQGDERHIIFLSMVAAQGERRMSALTSSSARQRFNVAVSRAQDQLWLFHSATLSDLSPLCLRHRLLTYMKEPKRAVSAESEQKFDSNFEREVYRKLTDRGFHVRTQVTVGDPTNHKYSLDLVVEGMQGKLVVECDGDRWHGPERYEYDMARQRDLERSGWQFARIMGSEFYRDKDAAMLPIWAELNRLGISPGEIKSDE